MIVRQVHALALLAALAAAGAGCSGGKSSSKSSSDDGASKPVVSQARTGPVTPFGPRAQTTSTVAYAPGADAVLSIWKSRFTFFDGTVAAPATLEGELIPAGVTQTVDLQLVSPLVRFKATDAAGATIGRDALRKDIKVESIVDRFIDEKKTVVLLLLNYGTADEKRYMILPSDLTISTQADNTRLVVFNTRDTNFAYAVAATKDGKATGGYGEFPAVPSDSTDLKASADGVDDEAGQAKLSWTPAEGSRTGYRLKVAYEAITTTGCEGGTDLDNATIDAKRQSFPVKAYTDSYIAKDLTSDSTVYFQLCSTNSRTPVDVSPGINLTYELPKRAKAVLTNTPADPSNATALAVTVGGDGITDYQYALLAGGTSCDGATYSAWTGVSTPITDVLTEGAKLLCVLGKKSAANIQVVATTYAFTVDQTPPGAFTVDAIVTPMKVATPVFTWQAASGKSSYDVKIASDLACSTVVQTFAPTGETATATTLADGTYYLCVSAVDAAGNRIAASNDGQSFEVDTAPPVFTSLALANDAADGYVNAADRLLTNAVVGPLTASGYVTDAYKLVTAATTCNGSLTYGAAGVFPVDNTTDFGADGTYKVCVKLTDAAGNVTYGASTSIVKDTVAPAFTSLARANDAADGFINAAERSLSNALVGTLAASGYTTAVYKLVTSATTCSGVATWGAVPKDDSTDFGSDGSYKVCVKLTDLAGNPPAYGASSIFTLDTAAPGFTSIDLVNQAADTYINLADSSLTGDLAGNLVATGYSTDDYKLAASGATCSAVSPYGAMPKSNNAAFGVDGDYQVCIRLTDAAGNVGYAASPTIHLKKTPPSFTSLARANDAADGYINTAERSSSSALAGTLVGSYDTATYALVPAATSCTGSVTYGAMPQSNSTDFGAEGAYKVCAELTDTAGNPAAHGATSSFTLDTTAPTATSIASTTADGSYGAGSIVDVTVTFSESVALTGAGGNVLLKLETGATDRYAIYQTGAPGTALSFDYTVQAGDTAADLNINGSAPHFSYTSSRGVADLAGNPLATDASGATSLATNANLVIDTTAPSAFTITGPSTPTTVNTPTVTWADPGNADKYDVKIDNDSDCSSPTQTYSNLVVLSKKATTLADGVWYVCVTAKDNAGNTTAASNNGYTFTVATGTWTATAVDAVASARYGAPAVWDTVDSRMIVWGGYDQSDARLGSGAEYDPATNTWAATSSGTAPSARYQHTATWTGTKMIVWGGDDGARTKTGSIYTPGGSWSDTDATGAPSARVNHTAVWDTADGKLIVWGGHDASGTANSGSMYDPVGNSWTATDVLDADLPGPREQHTAVWTGATGNAATANRMIVWGGLNGTPVGSGAMFNPAGPDYWEAIATLNAPSPRVGHTAIWTGSKMVIFGGHSGSTYYNDGAIYDPATNVWTPIASTGAPTIRADHVAVWDSVHAQMIVYGGTDGSAFPATGAALDPATNTWVIPALNASGAPAGRAQAAAVWGAGKMLIFGGKNGSVLDDGGRFAPP